MSNDHFASEFLRRVINSFVEFQDLSIQFLLSKSQVSFERLENIGGSVIVITYTSDRVFFGESLWKNRERLKRPEILTSAYIRIEIDDVVGLIDPIEIDMPINVSANPLSDLEALQKVKELEASQVGAAITFFSSVRTQGLPLVMNSAIEEFTGFNREILFNDDSFRLFMRSDDALESLRTLERELREHGRVVDYPLISERTNGEFGTYTIDAWYVDWSGQEARLTAYKSFTRAAVQRR